MGVFCDGLPNEFCNTPQISLVNAVMKKGFRANSLHWRLSHTLVRQKAQNGLMSHHNTAKIMRKMQIFNQKVDLKSDDKHRYSRRLPSSGGVCGVSATGNADCPGCEDVRSLPACSHLYTHHQIHWQWHPQSVFGQHSPAVVL